MVGGEGAAQLGRGHQTSTISNREEIFGKKRSSWKKVLGEGGGRDGVRVEVVVGLACPLLGWFLPGEVITSFH